MADLRCYYCGRRIFLAPGTTKTFMVEVDPLAPSKEAWGCKESPSLMHYPEQYKIVDRPPTG